MRGHSPSKTGVNALMTRASIFLRRWMDCRVEPGNDERTRPIDPVLRPGCVASSLPFPRTNVRGSGAPLDASVRTSSAPLPQVGEPLAWAACDLVPLADDTRAHARRRSTAATFGSEPFPINRAMRRLSLANAPAMAASYGGLSVVRAGRSTGASRDVIASHAAGAAPAPPTERL